MYNNKILVVISGSSITSYVDVSTLGPTYLFANFIELPFPLFLKEC